MFWVFGLPGTPLVLHLYNYSTIAGGYMASPTLNDIKTYLGETSFSDAAITEALTAETAAQANRCTIPAVFPADLAEALKRRVARNLGLRGLPLAVIESDAEFGPSFLPGIDAVIRMYEAPYRKMVVA